MPFAIVDPDNMDYLHNSGNNFIYTAVFITYTLKVAIPSCCNWKQFSVCLTLTALTVKSAGPFYNTIALLPTLHQ